MITQQRLHEVYSYDTATGEFRRRSTVRRWRVGQIAGAFHHGYVRINIDREMYYAHRLAWLYVYGKMPDEEIDHINHCRSDNRLDNLRLASRMDNGANLPIKRNNTSGVSGVSWATREQKWEVHLMRNGVRYNLGQFSDFDQAVAARRAAEQEHFGDFAPSRLPG